MAARIAITVSATTPDELVGALRVLVFANLLWLRSRPHAVLDLYDSGVRFRPEPTEGSGIELYQTIPEVYAQGWGDCDDVTGWRCAELLARGVEGVDVALESRGPRVWHAVVRLPNGHTEDVAANLRRLEVQRWRRS